jgi:ubiquinone/menaquinone biosynthesis C-methylase UbiE
MVEAGNRRAQKPGLANLRFQQGDTSGLRALAPRSFDRAVSIFGAMFAPKPTDGAKEMVIVTKPGGLIFMGNWIPGDPTLVAQILRISAAHSPPPPEGFVSPMKWGVASDVAERFTGVEVAREKIACARDTCTFATFRRFYGPTMNAFEAAEKAGRADELARELVALFESQNQNPTRDRTIVPATFLRVSVTV